ncbi:MAG: type I 3-dehydroquinate dehydratase, partial [Phycisphaerales bacterium]|nr:type I 3-dehydroquinate dehydratase [Phycisphaerales bacterium]
MSTLICVPIMVENPHEALDDAMLARAKSAELVEYRVDSLFKGDEESTHAVEELVAESPLPCIITCRPKWEGGNGGGYEGTEEARLALFEHLVSLDQPPRYIDIELSAIERTPGFIDRVIAARTNRQGGQNSGPTLLISVHDFAQRPADLYKMMSKMRRFDACRVHKYAWRARSIRDNLELFELLRERDRPTIALGMGEFGLMSRVLAPKFGGFLTFASLRDDSATAPGQPTLEELLNLYRFRSINAKNRVYGVIGWPVAQSRSPHIHNASFEAIEHNGVYLPLPVIEGWESFKATLGALLDDQHLDFAGCSVTIPHKEHLLRFAREDQSRDWTIDPIADRIGAANTLVVRAGEEGGTGGCSVHNTDAEGVLAPLRARLGTLEGVRIGIIGAGGAARAAAVSLADAGATILIHNRSRDRAE